LADVEAGKAVYLSKAKCNNCHPLQATPGGTLRAPSLLSAGQHSTDYLLESIRRPSQTITKGYSNWNVWLEDGRVVTGRIVRSTPERIDLITDREGDLRVVSIDRDAILQDDEEGDGLQEMPHSMMPDNVASSLSEEETRQLLAFLQTLN
jgi:putative heme-binding domain-containing protein